MSLKTKIMLNGSIMKQLIGPIVYKGKKVRRFLIIYLMCWWCLFHRDILIKNNCIFKTFSYWVPCCYVVMHILYIHLHLYTSHMKKTKKIKQLELELVRSWLSCHLLPAVKQWKRHIHPAVPANFVKSFILAGIKGQSGTFTKVIIVSAGGWIPLR